MRVRAGDEVAILNAISDRPSQVREIAAVLKADSASIRLPDGRLFATIGGIALNTWGCIVPAREEHRAALKKRGSLTARISHANR